MRACEYLHSAVLNLLILYTYWRYYRIMHNSIVPHYVYCNNCVAQICYLKTHIPSCSCERRGAKPRTQAHVYYRIWKQCEQSFVIVPVLVFPGSARQWRIWKFFLQKQSEGEASSSIRHGYNSLSSCMERKFTRFK